MQRSTTAGVMRVVLGTVLGLTLTIGLVLPWAEAAAQVRVPGTSLLSEPHLPVPPFPRSVIPFSGSDSVDSPSQRQTGVVTLTMDNMVDLTMSSSFMVRRIELEVERDRHNLRAQQARLKSSVDLEMTVPAFRLTSEPRWNSDLQKNEIIREHTRQWEGEISVRQPVILFGFPTNGYLSINNRVYRYNQIDRDGVDDITYYNRYYISYYQPLFQPNNLKNELEQAQLRLESTQMEYHRDILNLVSGVSDGYNELLQQYERRRIRRELVEKLEGALELAEALTEADPARAAEADQIQVELANARERLQSAESSLRLFLSYVRQQLGLSEGDSLAFEPVFHMDPVSVEMDRAVLYAMDLTPRMRELDIDLRNQEISLDRTRGWGGFRMDVRMSYGREVRDDAFGNLWVNPENSYTINISAFLPIWDWGGRRARIAASEIGIEQVRLRREEAELDIVSGVRNEVLNVRDREARTMALQEALSLAQSVSDGNLRRFEEGTIAALDLLQALRRETDTAENYISAYVSWRGSLRRLRQLTYYDFELDRPILEWFRDEGWIPEDGIG